MGSFKDYILKFAILPWLLLLFFFTVCFTSDAQPPRVNTFINRQNIVIGEPIHYKVEAIFPGNTYTVNWLTIPDSVDHFEVIERKKIDTVESNGMVKILQYISITSFDSGVRTIPAFAVNFNALTGGTALKLFTDSIRINVSFSPMDSTKTFHDIKTIVDVKDEWPLWMWIAAGLSALLLIFLIYYLVKSLRKKKPEKVVTTKLSPLEEAVQLLNELQQQQLLYKGEVKQFHSRLGEIFKRYISRKMNVSLVNLTSGEILITLTELISKENIGVIANNIRMADAVKFAKYIPGNMESEEALLTTKKVIQQIDLSFLKSKSDI